VETTPDDILQNKKQKQKRSQPQSTFQEIMGKEGYETKCPLHLGDNGNTSKQCEVNWCTATRKMT
jgi:hypothetical protein